MNKVLKIVLSILGSILLFPLLFGVLGLIVYLITRTEIGTIILLIFIGLVFLCGIIGVSVIIYEWLSDRFNGNKKQLRRKRKVILSCL